MKPVCYLVGILVLCTQGLSADDKSSTETTYVASVAMHSEMGAPVTNLNRIHHWCARAHDAGARFAVFPEECITRRVKKLSRTPNHFRHWSCDHADCPISAA